MAPVALGQSTYQIVDLTEQAARLGVVQSEARAINEAGDIVGFEVLDVFIGRAIVWAADGTIQLPAGLPEDNRTMAVGVGVDGSVLGQSALVTFEQLGELLIIHECENAIVWQNGKLVNLNDLVIGGDTFIDLHFSRGSNAAGQIVGYAGHPDGPPFNSNGFLLDNGFVTDLGSLERPEAINDVGQIAGSTQGSFSEAYLWDDGALTNLGDHPSIVGVSEAWAINNDGLIVGEAKFSLPGPEEPAAWIDGVPVRLVPELNRPQGTAVGVNDQGMIVGWFNDLDELNSPFIGFVCHVGVRTELLDLIPPDEGWEVLFPWDINDQGQIVGGAIRNGTVGHAFVMTPVSACVADLDGDGDVGTADLLTLLAAWGTDPGGPPDFDGDGNVGTMDLLELLANWGPCP